MTTVESRLEPGDVLVDPAPRVSDPEAGRRSRKKQRTRDDLIAAGDYLFATQGFDATTTTDIADRADVSQRTLFRHFPTKESLLYGDLDDARLQLRESLAARPAVLCPHQRPLGRWGHIHSNGPGLGPAK